VEMKNTPIVFDDGKELIVHHSDEFTAAELKALKSLTSVEFERMVVATGRFKKIPMQKNPFLNAV
jgi:hypothetical protein